jgi:phosphoribosylformylglycinamidine cyclo-ligase
MTVGDALLAPHRSYLSMVRPLLDADLVKGMAHITGGGLSENLPRMLPEGCAAEVDQRAWSMPPIFRVIEERGGIARAEMFRAFNMGVGLVIACAPDAAERVLEIAAQAGEPKAVRLGRVVSGDRGVRYV